MNQCPPDKCDHDCVLPPYIMRLMRAALDRMNVLNESNTKMDDYRRACHAVLSDFRDDLGKDKRANTRQDTWNKMREFADNADFLKMLNRAVDDSPWKTPKPTYCKSCRQYYYTTHICPVQVKDISENARPGGITFVDKRDMGLSPDELRKKYGMPLPR